MPHHTVCCPSLPLPSPSLCKKFLSPTAHSCSPLPLCAAAAASDAREGIATMWLTVHLRQPTLLNIHFRRQLPRQPWATPTYPVLSSPRSNSSYSHSNATSLNNFPKLLIKEDSMPLICLNASSFCHQIVQDLSAACESIFPQFNLHCAVQACSYVFMLLLLFFSLLFCAISCC